MSTKKTIFGTEVEYDFELLYPGSDLPPYQPLDCVESPVTDGAGWTHAFLGLGKVVYVEVDSTYGSRVYVKQLYQHLRPHCDFEL